MPIRFLLVGCGAIGERHAQLAAEKGILLAVCDTDENKLRRFTKRWLCYGYTSLAAMLREQQADALIVCTPNGMHARHSIAGLKAGLHVLCEKPMAITLADAKRMNATAEKAGKHLVIVKQNRYNPSLITIKKMLDQGKLGAISSIQINGFWNRNEHYYRNSDWRGTLLHDGGTLLTQFSHFIDLLYWFFGPLQSVQGYTANRFHTSVIETEDTGVFSFVTKAGVPGTFHYSVNSKDCNFEGSLTILAQKATIKIGGPYLNAITYQQPRCIPEKAMSASMPPNRYKGYEGSMANHAMVYDAFLALLSGKKEHNVSGKEGAETIQMITQFYKAAKKHA